MSRLKFEANDFAGPTETIDHISWDDAAIVANHKFDQWLSEQQVVYGSLVLPPHEKPIWGAPIGCDTHKARLVCIEELKPKECPLHLPAYTNEGQWDPDRLECGNCGKRLKASWSVDE